MFFFHLHIETQKSTRDESFGPSQVLPQRTSSHEYVRGLLDFQEYVRVFQGPRAQNISITFLSFQILVSPLFAPNVIHFPRQQQ